MRCLIALVLILSCSAAVHCAEPQAPSLSYSCTFDPGADLGQSFGTLFDLLDADGNVVGGAGFQDVYNTHFRNSHHTLQFFVKPSAESDQFVLERLPHPDLDCGVYLFDLNGEVYATTNSRGRRTRRWDEQQQQWLDEGPRGITNMGGGDGVMPVGDGHLTFHNSEAWYNDRKILSAPEIGGYHNFYYAQGQLCFYHRKAGEEGFTHLYACRWTPADQQPIDVSAAVTYDTPFDRETPFAWGQWENQVLTLSNMGGIYVFEDNQWKMTLEPIKNTSYQVYSALQWHDHLLLAQYPTGNIFEYQGGDAVRKQNWPPVLPGVASSARECQTLSVYRGDLLAGVWPWAEIWRRDRTADQWVSHGRAFSHPQLTSEQQHPYETEAKDMKLVLNHWGQRVTSMIPRGDSLFLSTSSKGMVEWSDDYTFLNDAQRREYGAVLKLTQPGNLAATIRWTGQPLQLQFRLQDGRLSIHQDGQLLAETRLPAGFRPAADVLTLRSGRGTFGPLRGEQSDITLAVDRP